MYFIIISWHSTSPDPPLLEQTFSCLIRWKALHRRTFFVKMPISLDLSQAGTRFCRSASQKSDYASNYQQLLLYVSNFLRLHPAFCGFLTRVIATSTLTECLLCAGGLSSAGRFAILDSFLLIPLLDISDRKLPLLLTVIWGSQYFM